jgi:carboxymethylenebutenolidase
MAAVVLPPGSVYSLADMKTYDVQYPGYGGDSVPAYVARPAEAGADPGIVIVHGVHGLEEHIKDVARRFAVHGYVAIAPALFSREEFLTCVEEKDVEKSVVWTRRRPDAQTIGDLAGAMTFLQEQPFVNDRIGLIGYCSGGRAALVFACSTRGLRVFVNCYSNGIVLPNEVNPVPAIDRVKELSCPMLGMFGADDTNPSPADVERLRRVSGSRRRPRCRSRSWRGTARRSHTRLSPVPPWNLGAGRLLLLTRTILGPRTRPTSRLGGMSDELALDTMGRPP